jgi:murein DD-endopeptidase MepM/ murein hydrolase activator NlpD
VKQVLSLADLYGGNNSTFAFSLDRMQQSLDAARAATAQAGELVIAAEKVARSESRLVDHWQARAAKAALLSDRLALEQRAGQAAERRDAANARIAQLHTALAALQQKLERAQQASASASFDPAASQLLSAPSYSGGYVFPVGGGPGVVSASHTHHDYPAVDIAAPMGSPLYALADAVVVRSWSAPDPACGIGLTLQAFDGQVWTYCHLSVLDSNVVPGAHLTAGEGVGLVGATGDATGPHLHLQLQPPTEWPQRTAWFQAFAGKAFTWSDSDPQSGSRALSFVPSTAVAAVGAPVFQVISPQDPPPAVVYFSRAAGA